MKKKEPLSLGEYLQMWIQSSPEVSEKLIEVQAIEFVKNRFAPMKVYFKNCYIDRGTLYISVSSAALKNAIFLQREVLAQEINRAVQYQVVERIFVR